MKDLVQAERVVLLARSVAIAGHTNPDGDSIGSILSLGTGIESLGKKVYMVSPDGVPKKYKKLPGAERIQRKLDKKVDLTITVDCSTKEMLGKTFKDLEKAKNILEIDHHRVRERFGDLSLIDTEAAAVGEIIYVLLKKLKITITKNIAQNILTSLIVETSSFRLPNVRPFTFKVCSEMVKTGLDFYKLVDMVFWSHSKEATLLSGISLARCKFLKKGRLAWSIIRKKDFEKVNGKSEDVDAVADEIRAIKDVDIVVFFREKNEKLLRVSLRSKGNIDVSRIAEIYGGGGHMDVSGCIIPNSHEKMQELLARVKKIL